MKKNQAKTEPKTKSPKKAPAYFQFYHRCQHCHSILAYCIQPRDKPYEDFERMARQTPREEFNHCEDCDLMTLQTFIAYDCAPE